MEVQVFGARLRELRIKAGLAQRELAEKIGVDFSYLSKIENGVLPPPSEKVILKLAEVLNAGKDELITLAGRIPADIAEMLKNQKTLQLLRSKRTQKKILAKKGEGFSLLTRVTRPKMPVFNYKNFARVAVALVLVIAVGASLWFASPTPVKAIDITFPSTPTGRVASQHTFTVEVEVRDTDLLPIRKIDLTFNKVGSSTYLVSCTNLPLPVSPGTAGPNTYTTSAGTVSISGVAGANWVYATSAGRQGYGYGYTTGTWGTQSYPTGYGYGYGYGGSYVGTTSITYTVVWTPPSSGWQGDYEVKVAVYGNGASTALTSNPHGAFTINPAAAAAPAPVAGEPPPEPTTEDISDIVDENGVFTSLARVESEDENVSLFIPKSTTGKTEEGEPLSEISITEVLTPPAPPEDTGFIGLNYDFEPSGATFDPEITLTFTYNPDWLPEGVPPENLTIAYYDEDAGEWVTLDAEDIVIDPDRNTITAKISHFTYFSVFAITHPAAFTASDLTITPTKVDIAQSVKISATITNTGDRSGSHEVTLKINGKAVSTKKITLASQASEKVTFTTVQGAPGTYTVNLDGLSGTFTVKPAPTEPVVIKQPPAPAPPAPAPAPAPPVPPFNWWLIGGIIAAAILIGALIWLIVARRRG